MKFAYIPNFLKAVAVALVVIVGAYMPTRVSAAGAAIVSVSAPTQAVSSGTKFTVNITVQPNSAIAGAQFNLSFNPALVSVDSVNEGNLFKQSGASTYFRPGTINNTAGTVTGIADAITTPGKTVSAMGTFTVITMTAGMTVGTSTLTLSNVIAGDTNGQPISVSLVNGQVVISGGSTTTLTTTPAGVSGVSGGGGGASAPTSIAGVTGVTSVVNAQGVFSLAVNPWSDDKQAVLVVAAGTTALTSSGVPLTQISMLHVTTQPAFPAGAGMVTLAYNFQPSGATFDPPAIVRFQYDPTLIPAGVAETSLQIAYYDSTTGTWITLSSSLDTNNHFITAQIAHFSLYAVTYGISAPTPAPTTPAAPPSTLTPIPTPTQTPTTIPTKTPMNTTTPTHIETTTPAITEITSTPTTAGVMNTIEPPMTTNNRPSDNILSIRMAILASAIGIAVFLITVIAIFVWLRRRNLPQNGEVVKSTGREENTFEMRFENPQNTVKAEKQKQSPRQNVLSGPEVIDLKNAPMVEERKQSSKSDFVKELETNLGIATTPWADKLLGFQTGFWDSTHGEGEALMTTQGRELIQLYVDLGLANNIVWLSTEIGHRSRELDESYIELCAVIADRLKRVMPSLSLA